MVKLVTIGLLVAMAGSPEGCTKTQPASPTPTVTSRTPTEGQYCPAVGSERRDLITGVPLKCVHDPVRGNVWVVVIS